MRIALLGAGGQLATDLRRALAGHDLHCFLRADVDLCLPETIESKLGPLRPDVAINTAAYNLVDKAETDQADAFAVNAIGVGNLARFCGKSGIRLIHYSTDYVFGQDAARREPWNETDAPGPVSVYGNSKLAGEHAVSMYAENHLVLRTCGLYGKTGSRGKGGNFVETMLRLADAGKPLRIVHDQICTPSYTWDVARMTARLLETNASGLVHLTNAGQCTWFEFAREIFNRADKSIDCQPIDSAAYGAPARRPPFSALALGKLSSLGVGEIPTWQDALGRYLLDRREK